MNNLPFNEAFEDALLIGVLQDPSLLPQINQIIEPSDFYKFGNKEIFKVLNTVPIDEIDSLVIQDKLSTGTKEHFEKLIREGDSILPSLSNILVYAEEIKSKSFLRQCVEMGGEIARIGYEVGNAEEALAEVEQKFAQFIYSRVQDGRTISTKEAFESFMNNLGQRVKNEGGVRSGFFAIDMILHRLEGLIILAAKASMGKTALAINIARNVAEHKPVLFFSLEQSQEQVFERMLASEAGVNLEDIRTGAFLAEPAAVRRIEEARLTLGKALNRVHVDERAFISTSHIMSTSRQKKIEWGEIGLIVVDYLHIMSLNDKAKVDALGDAVRELRGLGKELGTPIILLSQLSRQPQMVTDDDNRKIRRRPELSDLRGSGEIEQSADVVVFLYRDSYFSDIKPDEDQIEVLIAKHRNGRTGVVMLDWFPKYLRFTDQR